MRTQSLAMSVTESDVEGLHCTSGQVRSGQVRSECLTCTFRASCCSARLSRVQLPFHSPGQKKKRSGDKGGGGGGGGACTGGYKGVQAVRLRSVSGRKEMFYLTTHSTHFIYGYMASDVWLRIILIVRNKNPLPPHRLLFPINSNGSFICTIPQTG